MRGKPLALEADRPRLRPRPFCFAEEAGRADLEGALSGDPRGRQTEVLVAVMPNALKRFETEYMAMPKTSEKCGGGEFC